jgi:hypothetical protein
MFIEPYKILKHLFDNEDKALMYLVDNNYVNKYEKCYKCNTDMKLYLNKKLYICKSYKCRKSLSPFKGTIYGKMKLPINIQLHILYEFLKKTPCSSIASSLQVDRNTITSYNKLFRSYLKDKQVYSRNNKIGGRNTIVELDETKIAKRKYRKGHRVEGAWNGLKQSIIPRNRNKKDIVLYLREYQWRKKNREYNLWKKFLKD